jgi:hypothetical protein
LGRVEDPAFLEALDQVVGTLEHMGFHERARLCGIMLAQSDDNPIVLSAARRDLTLDPDRERTRELLTIELRSSASRCESAARLISRWKACPRSDTRSILPSAIACS